MHVVEVVAREVAYPSLRVLVPVDDAEDVSVLEYRYPGAPKLPGTRAADGGLELRPVAPALYYDPPAPSGVFGLLKQPMVVIMIVMAGMVVLVPRMLTKEALAEAGVGGPGGAAALPTDPMELLKALFSGPVEAPAPPALTEGPKRGKAEKR